MNVINLVQSQLGSMTYPLLICSVVTMAILLERFTLLSVTTFHRSLSKNATALLQQYQHEPKALREEALGIWLRDKQRKLSSGISWLQMITVLAPFLGLLGTIIGLIQAFETIGLQRGPIEPHMLADGLGLAMKTTAAGLIIAVPAIFGAHAFQWWADNLLRSAERTINLKGLELDSACGEVLA